MDWTEYDPFVELGVDRDASTTEVKRAYRRLSMQHHPDRGGSQRRFMRIAKAYAALTDPNARKNWQEHGNPDGPSATHFGIALPKWIVEKQNSVWVLGVYGLVFMIILPTVVGTWWYRTIKFSGDEVLLDTQNLFMYFIHRTSDMALRRVIMILAGAFEFERGHNSEIVERESDNDEVPLLFKQLPFLNEKNKEKPFCWPYSVKARALLHAHFSRMALPPATLERDRQYVVRKCPYLLNEMVNITAVLVAHGHAGRAQNMPRLETLECMMRLSPMCVQALWDGRCQLLQLPHIEEDMLRHFVTRKRNIRTVKQLVMMREDERRSLLRTLTEAQYRDIVHVATSLPLIEMRVTSEVIDDEDCHTITAGSIVTVNVRMLRKAMLCLLNTEGVDEQAGELEPLESMLEGGGAGGVDGGGAEPLEASPAKAKPRVWERPQKKQLKKKNAGGGAGKRQQQLGAKKVPGGKVPAASVEELPAPALTNGDALALRPTADSDDSDGEVDVAATVPELPAAPALAAVDDDQVSNDSEDDEGWRRFQEEVKKDNSLETKERTTHTVHCPHFPLEKFEYWWVYLCDRRRHQLISAPVQITSLQTEEEVSLKFTAPHRPGRYVYTVCLRSDSYVDMDLAQNINLDVKEARIIEDHPQWDLSEDEEGDGDNGGGHGANGSRFSDRESGAESDDTDYDYSD